MNLAGIYESVTSSASDLFGSIYDTVKDVANKTVQKAGDLLGSKIEEKLEPKQPEVQVPTTTYPGGSDLDLLLYQLGLKPLPTTTVKETQYGGQIPSVTQREIITGSAGGYNFMPLLLVGAFLAFFMRR